MFSSHIYAKLPFVVYSLSSFESQRCEEKDFLNIFVLLFENLIHVIHVWDEFKCSNMIGGNSYNWSEFVWDERIVVFENLIVGPTWFWEKERGKS